MVHISNWSPPTHPIINDKWPEENWPGAEKFGYPWIFLEPDSISEILEKI